MKRKIRPYTAADGTVWGVEIQSPSSSNAAVVFHHPNGKTARLDRYAWFQSDGATAADVTARLDPRQLIDQLSDADIARLFRRSMAISTRLPRYIAS